MEALWFIPLIVSSSMILLFNLIKNPKKIGLHLLSLVFLVTYGLSGFYSFFNYYNDIQIYPNFNRKDIIYASSAILIFISYIFSLLGYKWIYSLKKNNTNFKLNNLELASHISFFLMIVFIYVYISQYGGLNKALTMATAIRSGYGELAEDAKVTFVKYLMPIGVFPFLTYAYLAFIQKNRLYILPFILVAMFLFLAFLLMSGRTRIVIYIIALIVMLIISSNKKLSTASVIKITPLILLMGFIVIYGKNIFSSLGNILENKSIIDVVKDDEKSVGFVESLLGYYTHRVYGVEVSLIDYINNERLIFFKDTLFFPLYFIPERLTGLSKPDSISYYNTQLLTGVYDSMAPPGILAYGLYSLWIPGMFLIAFLYGAGFGYLDKIFKENNNRMLIILLPILLVWALYGSTGDTRIVVNGIAYILVFILLLILLRFTRSVLNVKT